MTERRHGAKNSTLSENFLRGIALFPLRASLENRVYEAVCGE